MASRNSGVVFLRKWGCVEVSPYKFGSGKVRPLRAESRATHKLADSYVAVLRTPYFYIANCNTLGIKNYIPRLFNNIPQKTANPAIHN